MHSQPSFETLSHPPSGNADRVAKSLLEAQDKAKALFEEVRQGAAPERRLLRGAADGLR